MSALSGIGTAIRPGYVPADPARPTITGKTDKPEPTGAGGADPQLQQLQQTDRAVRSHEQAHISASGGLAQGAAQFSYQRGSDGKLYAIGGEVRIDTSPGRTPEETISRARQIRAAAMAPADPSPQDRAVAAKAAAMELEARQQLAQQTIQTPASNAAAGQTRPEPYRQSDTGSGNLVDTYA